MSLLSGCRLNSDYLIHGLSTKTTSFAAFVVLTENISHFYLICVTDIDKPEDAERFIHKLRAVSS